MNYLVVILLLVDVGNIIAAKGLYYKQQHQQQPSNVETDEATIERVMMDSSDYENHLVLYSSRSNRTKASGEKSSSKQTNLTRNELDELMLIDNVNNNNNNNNLNTGDNLDITNSNNKNSLDFSFYVDSSTSSGARHSGVESGDVTRAMPPSPKGRYSLAGKVILCTLALTASLITVCGNLLVMLSFFLDRQIRNPTNYFILSLSVSDFLIGLFSMPFLTLYIMIGKWPFGKIICDLWLSLDYTVCLTSIYTVLFITIDRFCSVKFPAKYRNWRSPNKVTTMVALTWIIPICIFVPSILGWSLISPPSENFDATVCDVAWSGNKIFSFALVFAYFWSTLIVIIVLYIFIYQVARNLERKSREKQRKLSSLVGCSATNTGALVGVVALPTQVTSAVTRLNKQKLQQQQQMQGQELLPKRGGGGGNETTTPDDNDDQEDDFNTADSHSKLSKASMKKRRKEHLEFVKRSSKSGAAIGSTGFMAASGILNNKSNSERLGKTQTNNNSSPYSAQNAQATNRNTLKSNTLNVSRPVPGSLGKQPQPQQHLQFLTDKKSNLGRLMANNQSFASSTVSKEDDYSSSYDSHSHSDYDTNRNKFNNLNNNAAMFSKKSEHVSTMPLPAASLGGDSVNANLKSDKANDPTQQQQQLLQPRPESLAVMSYDQFAEKCAKQSSNNLNSNSNPNTVEPIRKGSDSVKAIAAVAVAGESVGAKKADTEADTCVVKASNGNGNIGVKEQIPFIDEEFDDLSYILTRRHITSDRENKLPIKEEKILIKSPLKSSFFQKFSSPIRSMSRRSSQKSQQQQMETVNSNNAAVISTAATKLEILSNQFSMEKKREEEKNGANEEKVNLIDSDKNEQQQQQQKNATSLTVNTSSIANRITPSSTLTAITTSTNGSNSPTFNCLKSSSTTTNNNNNNNTQAGVDQTKVEGSKLVYNDTIQVMAANNNNNTSVSHMNTINMNTSTNASSQTRQLNPKTMTKRKTKHENRARKALRTITFILGAFIFCFAPWHVVTIFNPFCPTCLDDYAAYHHFFFSCYFLCYLNSPINPFMYALANQQFKKTFLRILKGDFRRV
jgi:muscarinic acetylcholine receptor M3